MGVSYVRSHVGAGRRNLHAGWPPWTGHAAEDEPGFGRFPGGLTCLLIPLINSQRAHGDAERGYVTRHAEAGDPGLATKPLHRKNISAMSRENIRERGNEVRDGHVSTGIEDIELRYGGTENTAAEKVCTTR